jgi:NAD-specific glutamate dehydrogenase
VLSDDLSRAHKKVIFSIMKRLHDEGRPPPDDFLSGLKARDMDRFQMIVEELKAEESVGLAAVSVATRELSALADRVARSPGEKDHRR